MCVLVMLSVCALVKAAIARFNGNFHEFEVKVRKKNQGDCCICLEPMDLREKNVVAQKCLHMAHSQCLKGYRKYLNTDWHFCPLCKQRIEKDELSTNFILLKRRQVKDVSQEGKVFEIR